MIRLLSFLGTALTCFNLSFAMPAMAEPLATPTGEVILEIGGQVSITNQDGRAVFDLAMLDAMPQRDTRTSTPWYDGPRVFSGPMFSDLLKVVGAEGSTLRITAINDYAVEMPAAELVEHPVILASRLDGELMSVRDKGPLFVIYPFDEVPELLNEMSFSRSVWQVRRIEVLP